MRIIFWLVGAAGFAIIGALWLQDSGTLALVAGALNLFGAYLWAISAGIEIGSS